MFEDPPARLSEDEGLEQESAAPIRPETTDTAPEASCLTERFASIIKIEREDKPVYDAERRAGKMTHELGILEKLEVEGLDEGINEVVRRWQAADQADPELKALGDIIRIRRDEGKDDFSTFRWLLARTYSPDTPMAFTDALAAISG